MPLYIDLHIDSKLTPDVIRKCHVADKAIQEKYGVRYIQILLNEPQGYLFCLVEGPDKEACAKVHAEAHGSIACNILEITERDFGMLLAGKNKDSHDFTLNADGTVDTGYRAILTINLLGSEKNFMAAKTLVLELLKESGGGRADHFGHSLIAIFGTATSALTFAIALRGHIEDKKIPIEVRMGIDFGPPVEEKGNFFEDACRLAQRLSYVIHDKQVALSTRAVKSLTGTIDNFKDIVKTMAAADEEFLSRLMDSAEKVWNNDEINITDFAAEVGMSKSQLTRKIQALMETTPNDFLKEMRLRKAVEMLYDQKMNVAEITMALGFSNPSYFSKCFRERYGASPSSF